MNKRIRRKRAKASWKKLIPAISVEQLREYLYAIFIERYEKEIKNN
jgi:hypothetical protein